MDPRIDDYIEKSADFAKPVLIHIRKLLHNTLPDIKETWKWSFPHFEYAGGILCSMAAFKNHASFGFWKASLLKDPKKLLITTPDQGMGSFGKLKSLEDLPPDDIFASYILEAAELNKKGIKLPGPTRKFESKPLEIPTDFQAMLSENPKALATFNNFSPSHKKEYVEWITEAKTQPTREKRLNTTIEWLSEGKSRNWKYEANKKSGKN